VAAHTVTLLHFHVSLLSEGVERSGEIRDEMEARWERDARVRCVHEVALVCTVPSGEVSALDLRETPVSIECGSFLDGVVWLLLEVPVIEVTEATAHAVTS